MARTSHSRDWCEVYDPVVTMEDVHARARIEMLYHDMTMLPENQLRYNHEIMREAVELVLGKSVLWMTEKADEYEEYLRAQEIFDRLS